MKQISLIFVFLLSGHLWADIPPIMNYQGKLTDSSGVALAGNHNIEFLIYNSDTGGTAVWTESRIVIITNGLFDIVLGELNPIDLDFSEPYWLEVEVNGETLSPREKLTSVSYAYRAIYSDTAEYVDGVSITGLNDLDDVSISTATLGDILYYNGTDWVNLGAGTAGQVLTTYGDTANPAWEEVSDLAEEPNFVFIRMATDNELSSETWADIPGMSATLEIDTGPVMIDFSASGFMHYTTSQPTFVRLMIDDSTGYTSCAANPMWINPCFSFLATELSEGSHTFKIQYKTESGKTWFIRPETEPDYAHCNLRIIELK